MSTKNLKHSFFNVIMFLLLTFSTITSSSFAQENSRAIDSLIKNLDLASNKIDTLKIIFELCDAHDNYRDQLVYARFGVDIGERLRTKKYCALAYRNISKVHAKNNQLIEAIDWKLKEIDTWEINNYVVQLAQSYFELAKFYTKLGAGSKAQISFENALSIYESNNDITGVAQVKNGLGELHKNLNNLGISLEFYFQALDLAQKDSLFLQEANTMVKIGEIYTLKGDFPLANNFFTEAIKHFEAIQNPLGIAQTTNVLGDIYRQTGDLNQALAHYYQSIRLFEEANQLNASAEAYNNIGLVLERQNKFESARNNFIKSLDIKLENKLIYSVPRTYANLASIYGKLGNTSKANYYFDEGMAMAKRFEVKDELAYLFKKKSEFKERAGKSDEALQLFKKYLSYQDSILKNENNQRLAELQTIYSLGESEKENELLGLENQLLTKDKIDEQNRKVQLQVIIYSLVIIVLLVALLLANNYRKLQHIKRITARLKETNEELKKTLISKDEKELLLKEIHHRVKNNLQVINSLIRLQSSKIDDPAVIGLFQECEDRVKSMALVHEELYRTDDLSSVKLNEYISKLGNDLLQAYVIDKKIGFKHNVGIDFMGIDTLIPLGLIINEMITNSLKHGFKSDKIENPEIYIDIITNENQDCEMSIGDNGIGISDDVNLETPDTLGMDLILTLVSQLDGTITQDTTRSGTHYIVKFKNVDPRGIIHQ